MANFCCFSSVGKLDFVDFLQTPFFNMHLWPDFHFLRLLNSFSVHLYSGLNTFTLSHQGR